ncbi:MAG: tetratricopeptide repeat protein [Candidatus Pacebacteria bacterium]|nr:tetratricopeptide repeat protein [Candidatus Paceibacterota bacterium]MDD5222449.1 tetratricopeptide repeat protein [bacterium]
MDKDYRRLLEDIGIAKTVKDVSDLKKQSEGLERGIEELNYNQRILIDENRREREKAEELEIEELRAKKGSKFFHLGEDCFEKKKWSEALNHYEVAARSYPRDWIFTETKVFSQKMALFRMAQCLLNANKIDESIQILESLYENIQDFAADKDYLNLQIPEIKSEMMMAFERKLGKLSKQPSEDSAILNEINFLKYLLFQIDPEKHRSYEPIYSNVKQEMEKEKEEKKKGEEQRQLKEQIKNLSEKKEELLAYSKSESVGGILLGSFFGMAAGAFVTYSMREKWGAFLNIASFFTIVTLGIFLGWLGGKSSREYKRENSKIDEQIKEIQTKLLKYS